MAGASGGTVLREVLTPAQRTKLDETEDRMFYDMPRLVKHVDDHFLAQLTELYRQLIPSGSTVLDLMSSWVSHLPPEVRYARVIGHGLNAAELARNPRLDTFFVRDLNKYPNGWSLADASTDAVLCCVSVQYLKQPERVVAEAYRVLKPGGVLVVSFSNRMFWGKAVAGWRDASEYGRVQLVKQYVMAVAGFTEPQVITQVSVPDRAPALPGGLQLPQFLAPLATLFRGAAQDPFWAVVTYKDFTPAQPSAGAV